MTDLKNELDFEKVLKTNVNDHVKKKNSLSYLSWAYAWQEFVLIYPSATYKIKKDENNKCYFGDEDIGYMVYTSVTVNGLEHEMWLPVMDFSNKAMKLKSYEYTTKYSTKPVTVQAISMFDINSAIMRCLTKNLAMFGLGLYIYAGEDLPIDEKDSVADSNKTVAIKNKITADQLLALAKQKGTTEKFLLDKYKAETGKFCSEIKFLPQELKQEYYKRLEAMK